MPKLHDHLPPNEDLLLVFGNCAFIIHLWALYNLFYILPSWVLRMNLNDLIGAISYVLVFALLESIILWGALTLTASILPPKWFRNYFLVQSATLILLTTIFALILHFSYAVIATNIRFLIGMICIYLVVVVVNLLIVRKSQRVEKIWRKILQKTIVPAVLYLPFDLIGLAIIIFRNIF